MDLYFNQSLSVPEMSKLVAQSVLNDELIPAANNSIHIAVVVSVVI